MNGPKLWADMLAAINIPGAVVAGGCIRDCFLSVEPKDIDIFIPVCSREEMIDKLFEQPISDPNDIFGSISCTRYGNPRFGEIDMLEPGEHANEPGKRYAEYDDAFGEGGVLHGVAEGEFMGYSVNFIGRKAHIEGPQALIESFDFGILQVYYDGVSCKFTEAQRIDSMVRRATMMHDRHVEQSLARFFRFNQRNPGLLALAVPFEYDHGHSGRRDDDLVAF